MHWILTETGKACSREGELSAPEGLTFDECKEYCQVTGAPRLTYYIDLGGPCVCCDADSELVDTIYGSHTKTFTFQGSCTQFRITKQYCYLIYVYYISV